MKFSSLPFLLFAILVFIVSITHRTAKLRNLKGSQINTVYILVVCLGIWSAISSNLALSGVYKSAVFLALLPGLWFPIVPIGMCLIPFALSAQFRQTLRSIVDATPTPWFINLQALRIAALGTLYKTFIGEFPLHVELAIGISDLLFGFSALYIAKQFRDQTLSGRALIAWNLIGAGIIILPGEIAIQMGLPGPLQFFSTPPTTEVMFEFPLVLAPMIVVPLLVVMNGLIVWRYLDYPTKYHSDV